MAIFPPNSVGALPAIASVSATAQVPLTSQVEAAPNVVASTADLAMDGATTLEVKGTFPYVTPDATATIRIGVGVSTDSGVTWASLGVVGVVQGGTQAFPAFIRRQHLPAAGLVRYRLFGWLSAAPTGSPILRAGDGAPGNASPALLTVETVA